MVDNTKFYDFLKLNRISVSDLSFATKIPYSTLVKYVYGDIPNPPLERVRDIITVLGCKFEDIY